MMFPRQKRTDPGSFHRAADGYYYDRQ